MKKIDLHGHRFGRLLVVGEAPTRTTPNGSRKSYWFCRCDCGATSEVEGQSLRKSRVVSCGCHSRDSARGRVVNLSGRRFGRLVVTGRAGSDRWGSSTWRCLCDCTVETVVSAGALNGGAVLSCGCLRRLLSASRRWTGDGVSYLGMHDRLRATRGPARSHPCVDCGGPGREWSYDGADPDERREMVHGYSLAFSTDVARYSPRCSRCHHHYDAARRMEAAS